MTEYSVSEAKDNLPRLLDRVLAGEEVTITRRGKPIVQLTPTGKRRSQPPVDVAWLREGRITPSEPTDSVELIRRMRDEPGS